MRPTPNHNHPLQKRSPFIKKPLALRLKEQDLLIQNSSYQQLQKSLESCQRTLSNSRFPETSESAQVLRQFESKLLTRLNQLTQSSDLRNPLIDPEARSSNQNISPTTTTAPAAAPMKCLDHPQSQSMSIGHEGIVGFKRQLMHEQSFIPRTESLLTGMSMSQSIRLQEQTFGRERELAATEALSRLSLQASGSGTRIPQRDHTQVNEEDMEEEDEDDGEIILTEHDRPDVEKAWELAYQAGFSRGPGDIPQRMSPTA